MVALALAATLTLSGCLFHKSPDKGSSESVFKIKVGQCFNPPSSVKVQLSKITRIGCSLPHSEEAYAIAEYQGTGSTATVTASSVPTSLTTSYPGADVLTNFAQGVCAQRFEDYVGIDYLDSKLFFTYLLPSARSWESEADYNVVCFITTTGAKLTGSVKGTKR